jgi:hypothetical protein
VVLAGERAGERGGEALSLSLSLSLPDEEGWRTRLVGRGKLRDGLCRLCFVLVRCAGGAGSDGTTGVLWARKWPGPARGR